MQLFYCENITDGYATLDADESRHAVRVMRLREGDIIDVTDGRGGLFSCRIADADEKACVVEILNSKLSTLHSPLIHLAVAPTKNPARMEWLVEKAVEIGVGEITLLHCDHSERTFLKTDRLHKIAVSAMKQSLHTWLPRINPAVKLTDWLNLQTPPYPPQGGTKGKGDVTDNTLPPLRGDEGGCLKFIAHCEADKPRTPLATALKPGNDTVVLIGPEGDFSQAEIKAALAAGFQPVSLGPSRLRTETAALYAVTAFNLINDK